MSLACITGLHGQELVRIVENRGGRMVVIGVIQCPRCGTRLAEEIHGWTAE